MFEILVFAFIAAAILFKINHPEYTWGCMFGFHTRYGYSHEKHGMHIDGGGKVVGTKRRVYVCLCGKEKPAENKDWIRN